MGRHLASGGLGVISLFDCMGTSRTTYLEHVFKSSPTGKMILNNIESIVLEIGLYGSWSCRFVNLFSSLDTHDVFDTGLDTERIL